jgi:hypothetical protein
LISFVQPVNSIRKLCGRAVVLIQHLAGMQAKQGVHTLDLKHSRGDNPSRANPLVKEFGFEGIIPRAKTSVMRRARAAAPG